jgi:hypothetical protein
LPGFLAGFLTSGFGFLGGLGFLRGFLGAILPISQNDDDIFRV